MNFRLITLAISAMLTLTSMVQAATILAWDFAGATSTSASNTAASTLAITGILPSSMTRGSAISANNAGNSFRGTGFSNDGISLANLDFFQFTVAAAPGGTINFTSINMDLNGTTSFAVAPGVSIAYAYSLDSGANFTLLPTVAVVGVNGPTLPSYDLSTVSAIQGASSVVFKFFASGQTTSGGYGFQSNAAAGRIGLAVIGDVTVPEPSTFLLGGLGLIGALRRRR